MDLIKRAARRFKDNPALLTGNTTISFSELDATTARIAEEMRKRGIEKGHIIALVMPNSSAMILLLLALMRRGSIAAPMNYRFPASRLQPTLQQLQPGAVIGPESLTGDLHVPLKLTQEELTETSETSPFRHLDHGTAQPLNNETTLSLDTLSTIIHTSSSSGTPKAALHTLRNHCFSALGSNENIAFAPGDCWLLSLPLFHIGGYAILIRSLVGGGAIAVPAEEMNIDKALSAYPITHLSLVPTQLYRLLNHPDSCKTLKSLKAVLLGGSAVEPALLQEASQSQLPVYLSYGSTEMSSQITTTPGPTTTITAGRQLRFRELSLGKGNEILVKGPCLFQGYLSGNAPMLSTDKDGWFHTGDTGAFSPEGELHVTGRTDNMFISGGENIHPEEIERTLCAIQGVRRAIVVPLRDQEFGFRPKAFIEAAAEAPDNRIIIETVCRRTGRLKTPVAITRISSWHLLPGTEKIDRGYYKRLAITC